MKRSSILFLTVAFWLCSLATARAQYDQSIIGFVHISNSTPTTGDVLSVTLQAQGNIPGPISCSVSEKITRAPDKKGNGGITPPENYPCDSVSDAPLSKGLKDGKVVELLSKNVKNSWKGTDHEFTFTLRNAFGVGHHDQTTRAHVSVNYPVFAPPRRGVVVTKVTHTVDDRGYLRYKLVGTFPRKKMFYYYIGRFGINGESNGNGGGPSSPDGTTLRLEPPMVLIGKSGQVRNIYLMTQNGAEAATVSVH